ncbi:MULTISPECIES: class II fructose-bisphosphate aldolase [Pseudothermotoga]|jgi:fructose-bisphosphate aldolase class II|uniref:Ketose-bisphosphate aldolase n=1 Tax=Pseudothermotoga lettingae (strain ATCC BAA-301 / DSM 14385 / NBRC 107922 / TMO) TaxID=416591 RepID=A8F7Y1_PSELT|nr:MULTISPECIES: class II fructose-bisphosphate aldolase [Pseudothermotoga]ABV34265.1 ketose-bisphosphate aldolase [Pseudothermotoga lettingae TMO]KUK21314.1 MAG: Ketose-bisphosphate aldolase [Pseudothermotoga lettingae]MDI3494949.1 fructose-bisphosphate aldolase, class [Pseudothermotoga sp.]MDK2884871.1 fructose-bisphosphate aldolase, class [Pseudothermotoga sp.]GLI48790.1 fructose-bisphosphate aldolase [Pseudothermotoga lettingae TMO]
MLTTLKELLQVAYRSNYAIPAFNIHTYEDAVAIIKGAEEMKSPVILMASPSAIKHLGVEIAAFMMNELAKKTFVPVVSHLDHARELDIIFRAMKAGFTSVMYDGSDLSFEQNVRNTQIVVKVARSLGISVEAEIGRVGKSEDGEEISQILTEPAVAKEFFQNTEVDALAIAVGTAHAMQKQEAQINFERIQQIQNVVDVPLVLHGSSGVTDEDLKKISRMNFGKINIGTVLKTVYVKKIREILSSNPQLKDQLTLLNAASKAITETVIHKIELLGSSGKI